MTWKVGASRDLSVATDAAWDGQAAQDSIFAWAGWPDNPDPAKARQGFLIYDDADPTLRGNYKLPFAIVVNGTLKMSPAGLRAAASYLPKTDAPQDVLDLARKVIDSYQAKQKAGKSLDYADEAYRAGQGTSGTTTLTMRTIGTGETLSVQQADPLEIKSGARHSTKDQVHLDHAFTHLRAAGANLKAPGYRKIISAGKAITDAPGLRDQSMRACANCNFAQPVPGTPPNGGLGMGSDLVCTQYQFETEDDLVCDTWEAKPAPVETPQAVTVTAVTPAAAATMAEAMPMQGMQGMMSLSPDEMIVNLGEEIKSIAVEGDKMTIGAYGVRYGSPEERDLTGTYFAPDTNFGKYAGDGADVMMQHGIPLREDIKGLADHLLTPATTRKDEVGIFAQTVLDLSDAYEKMIGELAAAGKFRWSSGTTKRLIRYEQDGKITHWPITEWTLTPIAAEPRLPKVLPLKSLISLIQQSAPAAAPSPESAQDSASANVTPPAVADSTQPTNDTGDFNMAEMQEVLDGLKSIGTRLEGVESFIQKAKEVPAAPQGVVPPGVDPDEAKSFNALYVTRFGDDQDAQKAILEGAIGKDYRQRIFEQSNAFGKYLRLGEKFLDVNEHKALRQQIFPLQTLTGFVKNGYSVGEMKATMVEAQGQLGGYAVPPETQEAISTRLPGLTVVRGSGARVVTLVAGNGIEIPQYAGGTAQYIGALRGLWGSETQAPTAATASLALIQVNADIYTYKIVMSQSLVEDASNLITLVTEDIATTAAIDEDAAFLVGDGVGKPYGILPGGGNGNSLTSVNSGDASAITAAYSAGKGVKALKRAVATQYRGQGIWVGASATFGAIEELKDGTGHFYFDDLSDTGKLLGQTVKESESMPAIAGSAFPLLYGSMAGYVIVEKLGMSIARYQDSNTGPNVVQFHVRKRVGGRLEKPWMFAVMTIAA